MTFVHPRTSLTLPEGCADCIYSYEVMHSPRFLLYSIRVCWRVRMTIGILSPGFLNLHVGQGEANVIALLITPQGPVADSW